VKGFVRAEKKTRDSKAGVGLKRGRGFTLISLKHLRSVAIPISRRSAKGVSRRKDIGGKKYKGQNRSISCGEHCQGRSNIEDGN